MSALALTPKFQKALDAYITHIIADYDTWTSKSKYKSEEKMIVTYEPGKKFVKVIHSTYGSRSVRPFDAGTRNDLTYTLFPCIMIINRNF